MPIDGYIVIGYWWLLIDIILMVINVIILMAIGDY
jgi:hypothetical protein